MWFVVFWNICVIFFSLEKSSSIRLKKQEIAQKFSFSFWLEDGWSCGEKIAEIGGGGILLRPLLLSSDQYKKKSFPNWISWVFFYWGRRGSPSERKKIAHKLVFRPSTNVFSHKFNKVFVPSPNHPLDKNSACCTARSREFTSGINFLWTFIPSQNSNSKIWSFPVGGGILWEEFSMSSLVCTH